MGELLIISEENIKTGKKGQYIMSEILQKLPCNQPYLAKIYLWKEIQKDQQQTLLEVSVQQHHQSWPLISRQIQPDLSSPPQTF